MTIIKIMSTFSFALFLGALTTGIRMGLGASIVNAGERWGFVIVEFVLLSLVSAVVFYLVFNLIKRLLLKTSHYKS